MNAPLPGTRASVGEAELQVLGPVDHVAADQDESSKQNDSSLVIMVEVAGLRLLLTGDVEPPGQQAILGSGADLRRRCPQDSAPRFGPTGSGVLRRHARPPRHRQCWGSTTITVIRRRVRCNSRGRLE